jgi:hypothetical protein
MGEILKKNNSGCPAKSFLYFMSDSLPSNGSYGTKSQSCHMTFDGKLCPKVVNWIQL